MRLEKFTNALRGSSYNFINNALNSFTDKRIAKGIELEVFKKMGGEFVKGDAFITTLKGKAPYEGALNIFQADGKKVKIFFDENGRKNFSILRDKKGRILVKKLFDKSSDGKTRSITQYLPNGELKETFISDRIIKISDVKEIIGNSNMALVKKLVTYIKGANGNWTKEVGLPRTNEDSFVAIIR